MTRESPEHVRGVLKQPFSKKSTSCKAAKFGQGLGQLSLGLHAHSSTAEAGQVHGTRGMPLYAEGLELSHRLAHLILTEILQCRRFCSVDNIFLNADMD